MYCDQFHQGIYQVTCVQNKHLIHRKASRSITASLCCLFLALGCITWSCHLSDRSIGVLTYVMLTGISPFLGDDKQETFLNISQINVSYTEEELEQLDRAAVHFIKSLLIKEPEWEKHKLSQLSLYLFFLFSSHPSFLLHCLYPLYFCNSSVIWVLFLLKPKGFSTHLTSSSFYIDQNQKRVSNVLSLLYSIYTNVYTVFELGPYNKHKTCSQKEKKQ